MSNTSPLSIIKTCRICDSSKFTPLLKFSPVPLAGSFCDTYQEAINSPKYPITFVVNKESGLIQSMESISPEALFLKYKYDSSSIPALVKHFEGLATKFKILFNGKTDINLLEIGSNSNPLLNQLPIQWNLYAVDPSDVAQKAPRNRNIRFFNDFFGTDFVEKAGLIGKFDCITASNCLAHIPNLNDIFTGIRLALKDNGLFCIEVKDGESLMNLGDFSDMYLEHCVLWNKESLIHNMSKFGFEYVEHSILPFHGGLLRALFRKKNNVNIVPLSDSYFKDIKNKSKKIQKFYDQLDENPITKELAKNPNNIAFGASGKATMFLNSIKARFSFIVDESPLKIGKYIPGTGTPIVGPQMLKTPNDGKNILVTAWNYYDTIIDRYKNVGLFNWLKYF